MTNRRPLYVPPGPALEENPFLSDRLGRLPIAQALTGYVNRLKSGAVLAVDAEWGQGKSWFALNWKAALQNDGHKVLYIDAFEADYIEDPFLLIAGEIADLAKDEGLKKDLIDRATNVAVTIAPAALKYAVRGVGKFVLGVNELDKEILDGANNILDGGSDALEKILKGKIEAYQKDRKSISSFRNKLEEFAKTAENPIIIIIDELDRCKPIALYTSPEVIRSAAEKSFTFNGLQRHL